VWRQDNVSKTDERVVDRESLRIEDVQAGTGESTCRQAVASASTSTKGARVGPSMRENGR
jgi:hypothetical protein